MALDRIWVPDALPSVDHRCSCPTASWASKITWPLAEVNPPGSEPIGAVLRSLTRYGRGLAFEMRRRCPRLTLQARRWR